MAAFNSTLAITFSLIAIIFSVQFFIEKLFSLALPSPFDNLYISLGFVFLILIGHYFLFEHNKKYLKIESEFIEGKKNRKQWVLRGFLVFLYAIGSIIIYIFFI